MEQNKEYVVCFDSDGCVMDTMEIKHRRCFGPCLIAEWRLEVWEEQILARWNDINLYERTRGTNRYKGLTQMLQEVNAKYTEIAGLSALCRWVETSPELSNAALEAAIAAADDKTDCICMEKALAWSKAVNAAIDKLPKNDKRPFPGAAEGLAAAAEFAQIVVVSSANRNAVLDEWIHYGLLTKVDTVFAQDSGSKADCIAALLKRGYAPADILMVGDAPGDLAAAQENGVWFYPILARREAASWTDFPKAVRQFSMKHYAEEQEKYCEIFRANLNL